MRVLPFTVTSGSTYQGIARCGLPSTLSRWGRQRAFVDFQSLNFSTLEGATVRGHAVQYASS